MSTHWIEVTDVLPSKPSGTKVYASCEDVRAIYKYMSLAIVKSNNIKRVVRHYVNPHLGLCEVWIEAAP